MTLNKLCIDVFSLKQMNSCVTLTNFKVVPENPKFPTFTGHDYTIRLTPKSDIVSCLDELPQVAFNFCSFEEIESRNVEDKIGNSDF